MASYPLTPDDALALADQASEAIRALKHATLPADGYPGLRHPFDAYRVIAALAELARCLPQLLMQISAFLQRQLQLDIVEVDGGEFRGDPLGAIGTASHALEQRAAPDAESLAEWLDAAQQAVAFAKLRSGTTGWR